MRKDVIMDILKDVNVNDCPKCGGSALLEEESGNSYSVYCLDCGAHTVAIRFKDDDERLLSAKKAAELWNYGKVIASGLGE